MGEYSKIEWTTHTFNPWIGCEKVSAGCKNCYAETQTFARVSKAKGLPLWGPGSSRHVTSDSNWKQPLAWNRAANIAKLEQPGVALPRPRVFCASLADVFEDRPELEAPRLRLFQLIEQCDALDWLLLTKRPENITRLAGPYAEGWPEHVWLGTTTEDQLRYDERWSELAKVKARVRFLSVEPMVSPVRMSCARCWLAGEDHPTGNGCDGLFPDWVILGGESGPDARGFDLLEASFLIRDCKATCVPLFMKQLGAKAGASAPPHWVPYPTKHPKGGDPSEWPEALRVRQVPQ